MLLELRERVGQAGNVATSPNWFLSRTSMWDSIPVVALHSVDEVPQSAVLMHLRCWRGIRTGVLGCGDLIGDGGVIALAKDQATAIEQAVTTALAKGLAFTAVATIRSSNLSETVLSGILTAQGKNVWQVRSVHSWLDLTNGLEGFLGEQSRKFRRNFRYYRRRAEVELGFQFLPELTVVQSVSAVEALHARGIYSVPTRHASVHEAALRNTPGSFAMGLSDAKGQWLSYVAGWREGDASFIEWQLNLAKYEAASLSTVMRALFVEHETTRGAKYVVFVGGTSGSWARACRPETCLDLLAVRGGLIGGILNAVLLWLRPDGQIGSLHQAKASTREMVPDMC